MTKDEALDMALEFVEANHSGGPDAFELIAAIKQARALDKMADNARELGLDYEPVDGTHVSKVWWDGEKLMAKPIPFVEFYRPVQQKPSCKDCRTESPCRAKGQDFDVCSVYVPPPAQEFVCSTGLCYYKAQPALKPLTNEQIGKASRDAHIAFCLNKHQTYEHALTRAVEAAHGITGETK
jgi:hypothetical protein